MDVVMVNPLFKTSLSTLDVLIELILKKQELIRQTTSLNLTASENSDSKVVLVTQ
ncbi:hypothetical protein [Candidatus Hodgkinia cicadicola]|uniref:hypothetical protein n=1 Tax=Candidatus Hodgkinia cicadicola TaxID=573658 RepID=UPI001788A929